MVTNVGCILILKDARHVPDMHLNLISTHTLNKARFESYFGNDRWKLTKGSIVYARGNVCCTLYKTEVNVCNGAVNATRDDASLDLWHKQMAHISEERLQILERKSLIPLLKGTSLHPCDYSLLGKHHSLFSEDLK